MSDSDSFNCHYCGAIQRFVAGFLIDGREACRECKDRRSPTCPNCRASLNPRLPKRYGTCKTCQQRFFVNSDQELFDSIILTKAQNEDLNIYHQRLSRLRHWGITEEEILQQTQIARCNGTGANGATERLMHLLSDRILSTLAEEHRFIGSDGVFVALEAFSLLKHLFRSTPNDALSTSEVAGDVVAFTEEHKRLPRPQDAAWRTLNRFLDQGFSNMPKHQICSAMAWHLHIEGRNCSEMQRRSFQEMAMLYDAQGVEFIEILAGTCKASADLHGTRVATAKFVSSPCIPCDDCDDPERVESCSTSNWCNCTITAVYD